MMEALIYTDEVKTAIAAGKPVVALESTVITHGLPRPQNLKLAQDMQAAVRAAGAVPATIAVLDGAVHVGLTAAELERIALHEEGMRKISRRDFGIALARRECGGTTVAGTALVAHRSGIRVFATGGIGGVHRSSTFDISADLLELGRTPVIVVCAGAKAILDLPATLEVLETQGVPVIGYQTADFPAFYSLRSGLKVTVRTDSPAEIAAIARRHWGMGLESAVLVGNPPPAQAALPAEEIERVIQQALAEAAARQVHGAAVTPFLLERVSQLSGGDSLRANLALLLNNADLAARIAAEL